METQLKPKNRYLCTTEDRLEGLVRSAVKADNEDDAAEKASNAAAERGCSFVRDTEIYTVEPGFGLLTEYFRGKTLPLQVLQSADPEVGFYIGTLNEERLGTRESAERYPTYGAAQQALIQDTWTQRSDLLPAKGYLNSRQAAVRSQPPLSGYVKHGFACLAQRFLGKELPLQVLQSYAGFYIGTWDQDGPQTRESEEYYRTREAAQQAFNQGKWTQRFDL